MASEEGQVISCHTVGSWTEQIQKGNEPDKLVPFFLSFLFLPFCLPSFLSCLLRCLMVNVGLAVGFVSFDRFARRMSNLLVDVGIG